MKGFYSVGRFVISVVIFYCLFFVPDQVFAQGQLHQAEAPPNPYQQSIESNPIPGIELAESIASETAGLFEQNHKDKTAIFLLYEIGLELKEDFSFTSKTHKILKILNDSGKDLGEVPVPYEKGREKVTKLEAFVITPDGEKHTNTKIQDLKVYEGLGMYSDSRMKVISFPQVGVGSVLDYALEIEAKESPIKNAFWQEYHFKYSLPIKEAKITFTFPKSIGMQYKEFNLDYKPTITETETTITYSWHLKNIYHKYRSVSYSPPPKADRMENVVEFSSLKTWADVSNWYYSLIQKNLKINSSITRAAKKSVKGQEGIKNKTRAILEYIQKNFRYVSMSFGDNTLEPHPTSQVFRNKYGDCKDLSLLCLAMLDIVGIKSHLALFNDEFSISDPQHDLPYPTLFNHVVLVVKDKEDGDFFIDPLLEGYDIGEYPLAYQQAYTFVITPDGGYFSRLPVFDEERTLETKKVVTDIKPDGSAMVDVQSLWSLGFSIEMRENMRSAPESKKEEFFEMLDASYGEVLEREWIGLDNKYGRVQSHMIYKQEDMFPVIDDMIIITLSDAERITAFTEKERKLPIFYYLNRKLELVSVYKIPEGFRASHIPNDIELGIGFYNISRKYEHNKNEIIETQITLYKRTELPAKEYSRVKDFFDKYPKKVNQRIVLKKIKPFWQEIKDIFARFRNKE